MKQEKATLTKTSLLDQALEIRKQAMQRNDEHHLEFISEINGITYINDARSLRTSSTRFSLESIDAPIILIIGGADDSENDYYSLQLLIRKKVEALIYLGKNTNVISKVCLNETKVLMTANTIEEAVEMAGFCSKPGNVVIFSPACKCFEGTINNRKAGNLFKKLVTKIK